LTIMFYFKFKRGNRKLNLATEDSIYIKKEPKESWD